MYASQGVRVCVCLQLLYSSRKVNSGRMDVNLDSGDAGGNPRKRKLGKKGGGKGNRKMKGVQNAGQPKTKRSLKMKKLVKRRLREYNSDDDNDNDESYAEVGASVDVHSGGHEDASSSEDEGRDDVEVEDEMGGSDDEGDEIHEEAKFFEGIRAFKVAFLKIMNTKISDDAVVSGDQISYYVASCISLFYKYSSEMC